METADRIIGLLPAAGRGTRLGALPFSKELLPLGAPSLGEQPSQERPAVAIDNALETMTLAGIEDTCIVISPGKWDIPAHIGEGRRQGQRVSYVVAEASPSVPASLDIAWHLTRHREVALLFPDIVFEPRQALADIVDHRRRTEADLTIALVPTTSGEKVDIVHLGAAEGVVDKIVPKPGRDQSGWTWIAAAWSPRFTELLHELLRTGLHPPEDRKVYEVQVADSVNAAIDAGLKVNSVAFPNGRSCDLGTKDDLAKFWRSGLD